MTVFTKIQKKKDAVKCYTLENLIEKSYFLLKTSRNTIFQQDWMNLSVFFLCLIKIIKNDLNFCLTLSVQVCKKMVVNIEFGKLDNGKFKSDISLLKRYSPRDIYSCFTLMNKTQKKRIFKCYFMLNSYLLLCVIISVV